jgi:hypothetical protein
VTREHPAQERTRPRARGALAISAALLACAAPTPPPERATGRPATPEVRRILVCSPNTVLSLPSELQEGSAPLRAEIEAYLRDHDREVEWVDLYESKRAWRDARETAKESGSIATTPAHFADELARGRDFDVLVMPSILFREVTARHGVVDWDGVKRKIRYSNAPSQRNGRRLATWTWQVPVTSLHLLVFSREGERVFEGRGGLEIAVEVGATVGERRARSAFQPRVDLFHDRALLREGVATAFAPYLPPLSEP